MVTLSWTEFERNATELMAISEVLTDTWELHRKTLDATEEGSAYLSNKKKTNISGDILQFDYHVFFHASYRVPTLCFNVQRSDGSQLNLDEVWSIFHDDYKQNLDQLSTLTQIDHPVLFRPFYGLHPCRTSDLLATFHNSQNLLISFLSAVGPAVHLNLSIEYGNVQKYRKPLVV